MSKQFVLQIELPATIRAALDAASTAHEQAVASHQELKDAELRLRQSVEDHQARLDRVHANMASRADPDSIESLSEAIRKLQQARASLSEVADALLPASALRLRNASQTLAVARRAYNGEMAKAVMREHVAPADRELIAAFALLAERLEASEAAREALRQFGAGVRDLPWTCSIAYVVRAMDSKICQMVKKIPGDKPRIPDPVSEYIAAIDSEHFAVA